VLAGACAAFGVSACGSTRQDAREVKGNFAIEVVKTSFPALQSIARPTTLALQLRNAGTRTAPSVAVTLDSLNYTENYPGLAAPQRPVWVIEHGPGPAVTIPVQSQAVSPPGGGETVYVNTWTLGPLAAGATETLFWRLTPVKAGVHTVHYLVSAGLAGKARAVRASGGPVRGQLTAAISPKPPARHVNPRTGQVVPGPFPIIP
jgi:hypothetical protein